MNLAKSSVKNKIIKARISEEEYKTILEQRQASGLSESEFVRRALFGVQISSRGAGNQKVMAHICEIQSLLNQARFAMCDAVVIDEIQEEVSNLCRCLS